MKSAGFEKAFIYFFFTHSWLVRKMLKSAGFSMPHLFFFEAPKNNRVIKTCILKSWNETKVPVF